MAAPVYTVKQVASLLGIHETDVEALIKNAELRGTYNQSLLQYSVNHPDLVSYLKAKGMNDKIEKLAVKNVILCDRDQKIALILKGELEKSGASIRVASAAKDAELQIAEHVPDLLVAHLAAIQRSSDSLATVLRKVRETRPLPVIIFHGEPEMKIKNDPDAQRILSYLNVDAVITIAGGTRNLLQTMMQFLGLRTTMGLRRPLSGFTDPPKTI